MLNIIFVDDLPVATERAQAAFRAICDRYGITVKNAAESFLAWAEPQNFSVALFLPTTILYSSSLNRSTAFSL